MTSPAPVHARTAGFLLIGNEILTGKIQDANLQPLAHTLRTIGVKLQACSVVSDQVQNIVLELDRMRSAVDIVFTSGGIGPTHDDVTLEAVACAFGVGLVSNPDLSLRLSRVYGKDLTDTHLLMARVPEGSVLLGNDDLAWPIVCQGNVWTLPGIPELFRSKLTIVRQYLRGPSSFYSAWVMLTLDESAIKRELDAVAAEYADVEVGSYPKWFDPHYKTKVTFDGTEQQRVNLALERLLDHLPKSAVVQSQAAACPT
jgi:molybdenum cofactor synthesis domain-containing protein